MRERGEKVEQPTGFDYKIIGSKRTASHMASNVEIVNELDPHRIFIHRARERWNF